LGFKIKTGGKNGKKMEKNGKNGKKWKKSDLGLKCDSIKKKKSSIQLSIFQFFFNLSIFNRIFLTEFFLTLLLLLALPYDFY